MVARTEIAWAAGFFDGEGCFHLQGPRKRSRLPIVSISQVERSNLERFQKAVGGVGRIYGPYQSRSSPNKKPHYLWQTTTITHAKLVVDALWPYLGEVKRHKAKTMIDGMYSFGPGPTELSRQVNSDMMKARWRDPVMRAKMLSVSAENRKRLADQRRGQPATPQQLENLKSGRLKRWV